MGEQSVLEKYKEKGILILSDMGGNSGIIDHRLLYTGTPRGSGGK